MSTLAFVKVVYAKKGLFFLSEQGNDLYKSLTNQTFHLDRVYARSDPYLVRVIERLGTAATGPTTVLAIRELPAGARFIVHQDGWGEEVRTMDELFWYTAGEFLQLDLPY